MTDSDTKFEFEISLNDQELKKLGELVNEQIEDLWDVEHAIKVLIHNL